MKIITGNEMRDRLLEKLELNATYGKINWAKVKYRPTPIKFERCEDNYGWMTEVDPQQYQAMHEWCEQNFTHGDWYSGIYYVWVKDAKMAAWFTLRWS